MVDVSSGGRVAQSGGSHTDISSDLHADVYDALDWGSAAYHAGLSSLVDEAECQAGTTFGGGFGGGKILGLHAALISALINCAAAASAAKKKAICGQVLVS